MLIIGTRSVVRLAKRRGAPKSSWLALAVKPLKQAALANKMAHTVWGLLMKKERTSAAAAD